jgi:predicted alpha/beta hydrolase family esterase
MAEQFGSSSRSIVPARRSGWLPTPRDPLPFPSIVATSGNDPLGKLDRVIGLAQAWGSRRVHLGDVGHLNPAAGFGEWTDAEILIEDLAQPETRSVPTPAGVGRAGRGAAR